MEKDESLEEGAPNYPSLEVIRAELDLRLAEQDRRGNAFDSRAGIVIGSAGALIGLTAPPTNWANLIGMLVAVAAAFAAAWAIWPRVANAIDPRTVRNKYLTTDPEETQRTLLDTRIVIFEKDQARLEDKGRRLKWSALILGGAILAVGVGSIVDFLSNDDAGGNTYEPAGFNHHWHDAPSGPAHGSGPEHHRQR
ncbi:MAG: hypothetical protein KDB63_14040 [Nocardioidaceae bacterium]|nr:hypothetical protein [Nocardioidaceae bacterium]